jgi:hypothetical protein
MLSQPSEEALTWEPDDAADPKEWHCGVLGCPAIDGLRTDLQQFGDLCCCHILRLTAAAAWNE